MCEPSVAPGKLGVNFVPTTAGPHTFTITHKGDEVPTEGPAVVNVTHPLSLPDCEVVAVPGAVQVGTKAVIKVIPKDKLGNTLVTEPGKDIVNDSGYAIEIANADSPSGECYNLNVPARYSKPIEFAAPAPGCHKVSVSAVRGGPVGKPADLVVLPPGVVKVEAKGPGLESAYAGQEAVFQVSITVDDKPVSSTLGESPLSATVLPVPQLGEVVPLHPASPVRLPLKTDEVKPGILDVSYVLPQAGQFQIKLSLFDDVLSEERPPDNARSPVGEVPGSPFTVLSEEKLLGSPVQPLAFGPLRAITGCPATFKAPLVPIKPGLLIKPEDVHAEVASPDGTPVPVSVAVGPKKLSITISPVTPGPHDLRIAIKGVNVPLVGPTQVTVTLPVSLLHSQIDVAPSLIQLGQSAQIRVKAKDELGNTVVNPIEEDSYKGDLTNDSGYHVKITNSDPSSNGETHQVEVPPRYGAPVEFSPSSVGIHKIEVESCSAGTIGSEPGQLVVLPAGVVKIEAKGPGLSNAFAGKPTIFQVVMTVDDKPLPIPIGAVPIKAFLASPSGTDESVSAEDTLLPLDVVETTPGVMDVTYTIPQAGDYKLKLTLSEDPLTQSTPLSGSDNNAQESAAASNVPRDSHSPVLSTPVGGSPFQITCKNDVPVAKLVRAPELSKKQGVSIEFQLIDSTGPVETPDIPTGLLLGDDPDKFPTANIVPKGDGVFVAAVEPEQLESPTLGKIGTKIPFKILVGSKCVFEGMGEVEDQGDNPLMQQCEVVAPGDSIPFGLPAEFVLVGKEGDQQRPIEAPADLFHAVIEDGTGLHPIAHLSRRSNGFLAFAFTATCTGTIHVQVYYKGHPAAKPISVLAGDSSLSSFRTTPHQRRHCCKVIQFSSTGCQETSEKNILVLPNRYNTSTVYGRELWYSEWDISFSHAVAFCWNENNYLLSYSEHTGVYNIHKIHERGTTQTFSGLWERNWFSFCVKYHGKHTILVLNGMNKQEIGYLTETGYTYLNHREGFDSFVINAVTGRNIKGCGGIGCL
eukprot:TRINITY_DN937_c0_g1_i2.p1 TRINITY_DN937_c0_g1~~TRINITY_DN937_c0_g1_i2.p1  ORF type:complete len:1134 (+),score=283.39 TRINITY_DN937_c0_g1_i2:322-3402(+)